MGRAKRGGMTKKKQNREERRDEKRQAKAERKASKQKQVKGILIEPSIAARVQPKGDLRPAMEPVEDEVDRDLRRLEKQWGGA